MHVTNNFCLPHFNGMLSARAIPEYPIVTLAHVPQFLSLTLTCRQINSETRLVPYRHNAFVENPWRLKATADGHQRYISLFHLSRKPDWRSLLGEEKYRAITTLAVCFPSMYFASEENTSWSCIAKTLDGEYPGLERIVLWDENSLMYATIAEFMNGRQYFIGCFARIITSVEKWTGRTDLEIVYENISARLSFEGKKDPTCFKFSKDGVTWVFARRVVDELRLKHGENLNRHSPPPPDSYILEVLGLEKGPDSTDGEEHVLTNES